MHTSVKSRCVAVSRLSWLRCVLSHSPVWLTVRQWHDVAIQIYTSIFHLLLLKSQRCANSISVHTPHNRLPLEITCVQFYSKMSCFSAVLPWAPKYVTWHSYLCVYIFGSRRASVNGTVSQPSQLSRGHSVIGTASYFVCQVFSSTNRELTEEDIQQRRCTWYQWAFDTLRLSTSIWTFHAGVIAASLGYF